MEDKETKLFCSSNVTSERGPLGVKAMQAGKDCSWSTERVNST